LVKKEIDLMGLTIKLENIINKDKFEELVDSLNDDKINELITTSLKAMVISNLLKG
jgi:predicted methyltransferase MtxX (methanogen marker protein 4)